MRELLRAWIVLMVLSMIISGHHIVVLANSAVEQAVLYIVGIGGPLISAWCAYIQLKKLS